jgi:putative Holliday junction resolvase
MAVDYGTKRVGLAVSTSGVIATPHSIIEHTGDEDALLEEVAAVADETEAELIVLGVPRTLRHDAAQTEKRYGEFAAKLRQRTCRPVVLWDEALTTVEAKEKLREGGTRRRRTRESPVDHHAAAVILQSWLDEQSRRQS